MSIHPTVVRPPVSPEEYTLYFQGLNAVFGKETSAESTQRFARFLTSNPDFREEQLRGVFSNDQLLGGCMIHERILRMGAARISTGCIGMVVTFPEYRNQGVASTLMRDAIDFASQDNHALLLLDGIPRFYYRYGYIDMFDVSAIEVEQATILAQPPTNYHVRSATEEDASALLALYKRHYGDYTGSFERSLEAQVYRLHTTQRPYVVAVSPQGQIVGYLLHGLGDELTQGREIAADNWDALLALLQYHVHLLAGANIAHPLFYLLPHSSFMMHQMVDILEVPDTSRWGPATREGSVLGRSYHHRFAGWMACLISFSSLMQAMLPELQARWRRALAQWTGDITLTVGKETCILHIEGQHIQLTASPGATTYSVEMTPQNCIQLIFGYRPLARLVDISHLSDDAHAALAILFPPDHTWIAGSDWF